MASFNEWFTFTLGPSLTAIFFTAFIAFLLPLLLHIYYYRSRSSTTLPTFILVGPSGAGKTSILTHFERGKPALTHVSQAPLTVEIELPVSTTAASNRYRSVNDPTNQVTRKLLLVDTPGHGKLRHFAIDNLVNPQNVKGLIFVVDATALSSDSDGLSGDAGLTETAQYLHDILLTLQKRHTSAKTSKGPTEMPVLVAANKMDLFTAVPEKLIKSYLENEITKLRDTKSKGLLDSGVAMDDDLGDEKETLGGGGEGKFKFELMEEYNVPMSVIGGNVLGADGSDVVKWWEWIGHNL